MPYLDVGDGHRIYYEVHGAPDGKPAIVLHGGPGGGLQRATLRFFNLRKWRVVLFDQRGCGRSTPSAATAAGLKANTTWHLVEDIERLRAAVGVTGPLHPQGRGGRPWTVFGGSWGSTLAIAYAARHPQSCAALILRGIYLAEPWEADWLYAEGGASCLEPIEWKRFAGPRRTRKATLEYYGRRLRSASTRKAAAAAWNRWETVLSTLEKKPVGSAPQSLALLEHHYFSHNCWLKPGQLLAAARRFRMPVTIVQGRYDLVCPPASAVALHEAIPQSRLVLTQAGHSAADPATALALRAAVAAAA